MSETYALDIYIGSLIRAMIRSVNLRSSDDLVTNHVFVFERYCVYAYSTSAT